MARLKHAVVHDAAIEICTNQPENSGVLDAFLQAAHQDVVIDAVEELLEIDIDHDPASGLNVGLRMNNGFLCATPRPEAIAVGTERGINQRLQYFQQGLLN